MDDLGKLYEDLDTRARDYHIIISQAQLDDDVPGKFDGPTITQNEQYDPLEKCFYLAHSIGSIAEWSLHREHTGEIYRELRAAKKSKQQDPKRLERAVADYLAFEQKTWEFAVWILEDSGHADLIPAFTNFGRADLESMRIFHTTGKLPIWRDFFTEWNSEVQRGRRKIEPFAARPIPAFEPIAIPQQEIVQEDDAQA